MVAKTDDVKAANDLLIANGIEDVTAKDIF